MTEFDELSGSEWSLPTSPSQSEGLTEPFNRHSSLKSNNCNALSPARQTRVRPRTSKGITDLLLPQTSIGLSR
ncbi:hypothetical protein EJ07DRAFT_170228 [Lizonia empirigonia]|nr:hypothetical protein EJ07DRAFT_170228 [Lizonia empirigonia]